MDMIRFWKGDVRVITTFASMKYGKQIFGVMLSVIAMGAWAQPQFSHPHGLYRQTTLTVGISATDSEAEIRYTIDGSVPTAQSNLYTAPITINATTLLRAAEVKADTLCSAVTTASYIFVESVLSQPNDPVGYPAEWGQYTDIQGTAIADYEMDPEMTGDETLRPKIVEGLYDLPILSIVTDKDNLFSHENDTARGGIYIFTGPPVGDATGHGWTRPASVELIGGPQAHDMTIDCGLRLHGGHGRLAEKNPKHSFRLVFKDEYGPTTLNYPLFGMDDPMTFNQLVLRCHFGNSWQHWGEWGRVKAQFTRDVWARRMQRQMGNPAVNALHVHVFLNGMYWGLYNIAERIDDQYGKSHFGGKKSDYDVIKIEESGGNHIEASEGDMTAWNQLISTLTSAGDDEVYYRLQGLDAEGNPDPTAEPLLDVKAFIDYMLINQYGGNTDWDYHNWYAIRKRGPDSRGFYFLCWDTEQIFEGNNDCNLDINNYAAPTWIFHALLQNTRFVKQYLKRASEVLAEDGHLGQASVVHLWDSLYCNIKSAVYVEAARWGDYRKDVHPYQTQAPLYTVDDHFMKERNRLLNDYFPYRSGKALSLINAYVEEITGIMHDDWEVPEHWVPMTASMFHQWDGTDADAQPTDKHINVEWNLGKAVGGGGVVMMSASVLYDEYADLTPYDTLVLRGTGNDLRIIANRLVAHGPYKQIQVSFNANDPYWNDQWGAIFIPLRDIATALTNEGHERPDDFVHVNALKVAFGGTNANLRAAYLIKKPETAVERMLMPGDGVYYDLMGRPVENPGRGLYIRNGKKTVIGY